MAFVNKTIKKKLKNLNYKFIRPKMLNVKLARKKTVNFS